MMLMMMLAPVLLVGLIVLTGRAAAGLFAQDPRLPGGREILARRYAQGEISKEQHDQIPGDIAN